MEFTSLFFLYFLLLQISKGYATTLNSANDISRLDFPPGFVFGAATSAYQVEGAAAEDGRKPSIWDTSSHQGEATGHIASDQYHKYKEDVKLMHNMGLDAYRFSISWSRLIPDGHGAVNPKGLKYYNNLLDELKSHGIEAHVTLSHFDLPQALQDEYEGSVSPKFIEDFTAYADICFQEFGDRVKSWTTFNEPNAVLAGAKFFPQIDHNCSDVVSDSKIYLSGHHILLSHAAAAHLYRTKYQEKQKGIIGITLLGNWFEPLTSSPLDIEAAKEELAIWFGWFLDPLVYGRYPQTLMKITCYQLPDLTKEGSMQIKGSFDFIGINHYFGYYVNGSYVILHAPRRLKEFPGFDDFQYLVPGLGLRKMLDYIKETYKNPTVMIHENGYSIDGDDSSNPEAQNDTKRILYIETHIKTLLHSIRNGSDVRGFFIWSFLDCFEVFGGYNSRFGLFGVDFNDKNRRRYPRQSAHWYSTFLAKIRREPDSRIAA